MSMSERLAFLISVNSDQAIRGFEKIGATAEKELGRADARVDKFGRTATKVGAGMLAFAGVAGGALLEFASKSEEANHSQVLLQNAIANSSSLTTASAEGFDKLATSIQSKTAAENDSIVAGIATLANFQLTESQIRTITPLMVDYARRTGKDMPTAAADLGKALLGQGRALKAIGVQFKDTGTAGGNFDELVDKLRGSVGGFAEREGQTFSGSLERLHNQLGDLEEGVGKGVVDAFSSAIKPVSEFSSWLGRTSPQSQEVAGRFLAIGTAGIGAVGGLSLMAGQLIKMRDRFTETDAAGIRTLTTMGKFATGVGLATGFAAIATSLFTIGRGLNDIGDKVKKAASDTTQGLVDMYEDAAAFDAKFNRISGNSKADEFFKGLVKSSLGAAIRLRDALKAQGEDVSGLTRQINEATRAQKQLNTDAKTTADVTNDAADGISTMGTAAASASTPVKSLADKLNDITNGAFGIEDAEAAVSDGFDSLLEKANNNAKARADAARNYAKVVEDSNRRIRDAEQGLSDAKEDLNKISSGDRTDARRRVRDAEQDVADAKKDAADNIAQAKANTDDWTASLDENTRSGRQNRDTVQQIVENTNKVVGEMEAQHKPASEILAYVEAQRAKLELIGAQIGFNKDKLLEFLSVLTYIDAFVKQSAFPPGPPGPPLVARALAGQNTTSNTGGITVNIFNAAGGVVDPSFAQSVGREVSRQLRRPF